MKKDAARIAAQTGQRRLAKLTTRRVNNMESLAAEVMNEVEKAIEVAQEKAMQVASKAKRETEANRERQRLAKQRVTVMGALGADLGLEKLGAEGSVGGHFGVGPRR